MYIGWNSLVVYLNVHTQKYKNVVVGAKTKISSVENYMKKMFHVSKSWPVCSCIKRLNQLYGYLSFGLNKHILIYIKLGSYLSHFNILYLDITIHYLLHETKTNIVQNWKKKVLNVKWII